MGRLDRILNYTLTSANTWYKVFDENDYKNNRIKEVKFKLRETTTADHFRYNYDGSTTVFMTSTIGTIITRHTQKLYMYVPDTASQIAEIELIYQ